MKVVVPHPSEHLPEDVYGSWSPAADPSGGRVAFVSDRGGTPQVWLRELVDAGWRRVPTGLERVSTVSWSPDGAWLACTVAAHGSSRTEVWVVAASGGTARQVAGHATTTAGLGPGSRHGWSADGRLLLTETTGSDAVCSLLDPQTGTREPVARGTLLTLLDVSADGSRALLRCGPRGRRELEVLDRASGERRAVLPADEGGSTDSGVLSPDGRTAYAVTTVGRELAALVAVTDGEPPRTLAQREDAELEQVALSASGARAVLVWNVLGGRSALTVAELPGGEQTELALPRDVVREAWFAGDGSRIAVTAESWSDPRGVWLLDLEGGATPVSSDGGHVLVASPAATTRRVDPDVLVPPELHGFVSPDGTAVSGWLYRPAGEGPWPAVVWLHGGPESQERPVYNSLFQSLVAAGIVVYALNVRGSSGFGRSFVHADDLAGRYGAIDDVAAAAAYLVSSGTGAPGRLGVMGRSYGGYLTLAALAWHPDLFGAGVDVCGMSSFATFYAHTEPYIAATAVSKYGDPVRDAELLHDLSPMTRVDAIRAPLMVVHGGDDTNVPLVEATQLVEALAERGVEHRFVLFEGEGHELLATPNRVRFVNETVSWLTRHLAG
ncbi:dipeptidyl aminopeptidase/acylaminoacyl peptidase [Motilibacter peucedani]|uniref:Acyl-peptide hydrolase n=1 Tax=Motilibacter peucedani TaxID=598650 RepID=A0A420XM52_9ACTN|nr:prolyl oligopeptidase family serine peptidase [Motilibacter peucedani]RKS71496.1 dipeptidyl aminopeptidase/acylaminoacyl peptidase [Motilibacter peucedani]